MRISGNCRVLDQSPKEDLLWLEPSGQCAVDHFEQIFLKAEFRFERKKKHRGVTAEKQGRLTELYGLYQKVS